MLLTPSRWVPLRYLPLLFGALAACSSAPARLYVLSAAVPPRQDQASASSANGPPGSGSSQASFAGSLNSALSIGVSVTVPEYLDRLDIIERTSANEVKPNYRAQWAEDLTVTAARALTENLSRLLPSDDFVMLPSRGGRPVDYTMRLGLSRFESNIDGESVLAGRWSITDRSGGEVMSGHVLHSETAPRGDYEAMAAAMSRNLAAASSEIARSLERLVPPRAR